MGKRTSIEFSDCDVKRVKAIMDRHLISTEAAAIRWAVQTIAQAVEITVQSSTGELVRWSCGPREWST